MSGRTAQVRADFVRDGDTVTHANYNFTVLAAETLPGDVEVMLTTSIGKIIVPLETMLTISDHSGLRELESEIKAFGPYFTTSGLSGAENEGHVHFTNPRRSGSVLLCDLLVHMDSGVEVKLERVEVRNVLSIAKGVICSAEGRELPQWCPVCKYYHHGVGEKTDAGKVTRPCGAIPVADPRNHVGR